MFALGFRNPFRMSFHPTTGELWVGDVGDGAWEEVDRVARGDNHGWPCFEGNEKVFRTNPRPACTSLYDDQEQVDALSWPHHVYPHQGWVGAVTGGVFLTSSHWPEAYRDRYLFGDYSFGELRTVDLSAGAPDETSAVFAGSDAAGAAVQFEEAPDGSIWWLSVFPGELRRLVPDSGAHTCADGQFTASWFVDGDLDGVPTETTCSDTPDKSTTPASLDDGYAVRWVRRQHWEAGTHAIDVSAEGWVRVRLDGTSVIDQWSAGAVDELATRRVDAGMHTMAVEHRHVEGGSGSLRFSRAITGTAPSVEVSLPTPNTWVHAGQPIDWRITATDAEDGDLADRATLQVDLLHYGEERPHAHPELTHSGRSGALTLTNDHAPDASVFRVTATARDASGRIGRSLPTYLCMEGNEVGICR